MEQMTRILMIEGAAGTWIDEYGEGRATPEIAVGTHIRLRFDLRRPETDSAGGVMLPVDIDNIRSDSYYLALDNDYDRETVPKLLKMDGIALTEEEGRVYFEAEIPNTAYPGLLEAVALQQKVELHGEIGGYSAENGATSATFAVHFSLMVCNRVYLGGEAPSDVVNDPEYLNAAQVRALIAQAEIPGAGDPGRGIATIVLKEFDEAANADIYTITYSDETTQDISIPRGHSGATGRGIVSIDKTVTEGDIDTYTITYSDETTQILTMVNGKAEEYVFDNSAVTGNILTIPGTRPVIAVIDEIGHQYPFALDEVVYGESSTEINLEAVKTYRNLSAISGLWKIIFAVGMKGEDGRDFHYDASGDLSERSNYDGEAAGFVFAASETDEEAKVTTVYFYKKRSGDNGDWSEPLPVQFYAPVDVDTGLVPPLEFTALSEGVEYLSFSLREHPAAMIAAVCIDTADGELQLPYGSEQGVLRNVKVADDDVRVYFGSSCPAFETGRIYFAQGGIARSDYQIWLENGHEGTEADYLAWLRNEADEYIFDDSAVTDGKLTLPDTRPVIAVIDETGRQYSFALNEVIYGENSTEINLAAIMIYRNLPAVSGMWKIVFAVGVKGEDGQDGKGFEPDAYGTLTERSLYDGEQKDFAYLDIETAMVYHKRSNDAGDWSAGFSLRGDVGPAGPEGAVGPDGVAATVSVGTVTTGEPGDSASVTNSGTVGAAVLNFVVPRGATGLVGPDGVAATVSVGTVTTGEPGSSVSVINSGTSGAAVLDFIIPRGTTGAVGNINAVVSVTEPADPVDGMIWITG